MLRAVSRRVRDDAFDVLRELGLTTIFANPGSTEIPFLSDLPDDLRFVLALHEGSVVAMATGLAMAHEEPALVLLHTAAGLGNAVSALATTRVNHAPLVVLVGQQDRRHLAQEPFLAGRLEGLAGEYPVWVDQPVRPQDVPGAIARAFHEAVTGRGPALVIVPMDDWLAPAGDAWERAAPGRVFRGREPDRAAVSALSALLESARAPCLVACAGAGRPDDWEALVALAEHLDCPVWQESFGGRAGFPWDHRLFAGHLPGARGRLRDVLSGHDVVVAVGGPSLRQYAYEPGPLVQEGTRLAAVTDDPAEAQRSVAELVVLASPGAVCRSLVELVPAGIGRPPEPLVPPSPPEPGEPLRAGHVLAALGERLPDDAVLVEETPSSRPELLARIPARAPLGFVSPANGGLGFALPGALGLRMGLPARPVVAVVGDGSSLYQIQALWSAAFYRIGALVVVLQNGGYAVMDRLAEMQGGGSTPWPGVRGVDIAGISRAFGCPAERIETHVALVQALDAAVPTLAAREAPLLLEVVIEPDPTFEP
jgi:benzoylformate decarboxylase